MDQIASSVVWESKSIKWDINNFSEICGIRLSNLAHTPDEERVLNSQQYQCILDIDFLQSPVIMIGNKEEGTHGLWIVKLMKSANDTNKIDLNLELNQLGAEFEDVTLASYECFFKYRISVQGANGQSLLVKDNNTIILLKSGNSWCEPGFLEVDYLKEHFEEILKDDVLQLTIDISVLSDLQHVNSEALKVGADDGRKRKRISTSERDFEAMESCQMTLAKQVLSTLWKTQINSDVVVECADSKFAVHRSVLSCASPVLGAAFSKDTSENAEGKIVISDIDQAALELVLRFIYCDVKFDEPEWKNVDSLTEMLNAAEKYQLPTLKTLCFSKLTQTLNLSNAAQVMSLVYLFQPEEHIRNFVFQYVVRNINVLRQLEGFNTRVKELPAAFVPLLFWLPE